MYNIHTLWSVESVYFLYGIYSYFLTGSDSGLMKQKNSSNLKRGNIGIANMHKRYRRQDRDPG